MADNFFKRKYRCAYYIPNPVLTFLYRMSTEIFLGLRYSFVRWLRNLNMMLQHFLKVMYSLFSTASLFLLLLILGANDMENRPNVGYRPYLGQQLSSNNCTWYFSPPSFPSSCSAHTLKCELCWEGDRMALSVMNGLHPPFNNSLPISPSH